MNRTQLAKTPIKHPRIVKGGTFTTKRPEEEPTAPTVKATEPAIEPIAEAASPPPFPEPQVSLPKALAAQEPESQEPIDTEHYDSVASAIRAKARRAAQGQHVEPEAPTEKEEELEPVDEEPQPPADRFERIRQIRARNKHGL